MLRNYFLINLILIIVIALLGFKFFTVLESSVQVPTEPEEEKVHKEPQPVAPKEKALRDSDFEVISRLDLFRPSRSAPLSETKNTEKGPPKDPPMLFGTVILNENKTAILGDPDTKTTKTYRVNDSVAGYTISEILEDKVVLLRGGDRFEVKLRDEKKGIPKVKAPAKRKPARKVRKRQTPPRQRPVTPRSRVKRTRPPREIPDELEKVMDRIDNLNRNQ